MRRRPDTTRGAFTLIELLVVITLIVIVIAVTAPSIARLIDSANFSSAVNKVSATLGSARSIAMQTGQHTAVAFLYDTEQNLTTLLILRQAGGGSEGKLTTQGAGTNQRRQDPFAAVYIPAPGTAPVDLPEGMGVFGLSFHVAPAPTEDLSEIDDDTDAWYAGERLEISNNVFEEPWLFPRNDARWWSNTDVDPWEDITDPANIEAVRHAQTFIVQFSPDGSIQDTFTRGANRMRDAFIDYPELPRRTDTADPMEREPFDDPTLFDPEVEEPNDFPATPNPEFRVRTVSQLAVVNLGQLASQTGIDRPWFVRTQSSGGLQWPTTDPKSEFVSDDLAEQLSRWIDQNSQILSFNRYTGNVTRR